MSHIDPAPPPLPQKAGHQKTTVDPSKAMRKRLIITVSAGVLYLVCSYFQRRSISFVAFCAGFPTFFIALVMLLGIYVATVWNIIGVFKMWSTQKAKALIPLTLCIPFIYFGGVFGDAGLDARLRDFRSALPGYEKKVALVTSELHKRTKDDSNYFGHFPEGSYFNVYAELDTNGVAT